MTDLRSYSISFPLFGENFKINPPAYLSLFGFRIYFYGIAIALGFLLAVLYCFRRCKSFGFKADTIIDMLLCGVPSAVVCSRLYYCAFQWSYYSQNPIKILDIRDGGLAIYGGVIGAVVAVWIFAQVRKIPTGALLDVGSFGLLIGQAVGRWGNFFNREVFGVPTNLPWRMGLIDPDTGATQYVHPLFLYESLWNILGFLLLHIFSKKVKKRFDGEYILLYVIWYGAGRAMLESIRASVDILYLGSIPISQLVGALSAFLAAVLLVVNLVRHRSKVSLWVDSPDNPFNAPLPSGTGTAPDVKFAAGETPAEPAQEGPPEKPSAEEIPDGDQEAHSDLTQVQQQKQEENHG